MITSNDRLFCLLFASETPIGISRLNCYTYIYQRLGFSLDYPFRINISGVRSKSFARYLEEQVSTGFVVQNNGYIELTTDSYATLEDFVLTFEELTSAVKIKDTLDSLTDEELYLVCIVDIIIEDVIKTKGIDSLASSRSFIEKSVSSLCSEYTQENFNLSVALLRRLKKECMLNE